jgi:phosphoribosyl-ATP pyrophosphohydrolase/phosphoribosyl-AMP cyclohydrolase
MRLIPAIIQNAETGKVLMLGYMNAEALQLTRDTGRVTFYSRSKQRLWVKGETSGNYLLVMSIHEDCDQDALLILVTPQGPTCHQGTLSCFASAPMTEFEFITSLCHVIANRIHEKTESSYVSRLYQSGIKRIAQKIGEEGVEVALAAMGTSHDELISEIADLFFHILVLLEVKELRFSEVLSVLKARQAKR